MSVRRGPRCAASYEAVHVERIGDVRRCDRCGAMVRTIDPKSRRMVVVLSRLHASLGFVGALIGAHDARAIAMPRMPMPRGAL